SQGNNKFPFSNTLEEKQQGDHHSLPPSWRNTRNNKQQITVEITPAMNFKKDFSWSYIKCYFYVTPYLYLTIKTLLCQEIIDKIFKICYLRVTIRNIPNIGTFLV
ncbi:hypothetical protein, partial [Klebsiella pneumoniae]|uniref:hypothetical protein n=1 Tax=Klebsiella pneumoniae TaxID=573 RepID=UPI001C5CF8BF